MYTLNQRINGKCELSIFVIIEQLIKKSSDPEIQP